MAKKGRIVMNEEIINFGSDSQLVGILHSQGNDNSSVCVILLTAGIIHKVGPNRIYTTLAREIANNGYDCFRFDYSGIGDSVQDNHSSTQLNKNNSEIRQAMDHMQAKKGAKKFILIGLCSGAEDAFFYSQTDDRIVGLYLIDGVYQNKLDLLEIFSQAERNCTIRLYKKNIFKISRWLKVLRGRSNVLSKNNFKVAFSLVNQKMRKVIPFTRDNSSKLPESEHSIIRNEFTIDEWMNLFGRIKNIHLVFCEGSMAIDVFNLTINSELKRHKGSCLTIDYIKNVDHTFTPIWSQKLLLNNVIQWLSVIEN